MKINEIQRLSAINQYRNEQTAKSGTVNRGKKQRDELSISQEAKLLLGASEISNQENRAEKIETLRNQVSAGTYHVDSGKIAEKVLLYLL